MTGICESINVLEIGSASICCIHCWNGAGRCRCSRRQGRTAGRRPHAPAQPERVSRLEPRQGERDRRSPHGSRAGRVSADGVCRRCRDLRIRAGNRRALGIGDEALRAANPKLVHCTISAFGRRGPHSRIKETLILFTTMLENISDAATAIYSRVPHPDDTKLAHKANRTRVLLADLIERGDATAAEDVWRRHLTDAGQILVTDRGTRVIDLIT